MFTSLGRSLMKGCANGMERLNEREYTNGGFRRVVEKGNWNL